MPEPASAPDGQSDAKARGAFFTPATIANYLAEWAIGDKVDARVLDPTCGEAVFLLAAARHLRALGLPPDELDEHVFGVDIHKESLTQANRILESQDLDATLYEADFFDVNSPDQLGCPFPLMDAVIGNPPFIRYQSHTGAVRQRAAQAALRQGVRLSGLASSWAPLLVHATSFLKPEGRLAVVLPAELLTVHYAEPIRLWLRHRFGAVSLVFFEDLQFEDALERVVLLLAHGSGGCDAFSLYDLAGADDLLTIRPFDHFAVTPSDEGKWTDLLLTMPQRQAFRRVTSEHFVSLESYGTIYLGTVTGANKFFAMSESTRMEYAIPEDQLLPISPPGTKHLRGLTFQPSDWTALKKDDERVWLLQPDPEDPPAGVRKYVATGEAKAINQAYKCKVRTPWWRPPVVPAPDLFFTYMSHWYPRLVRNAAGVTFLNSMHGLRLTEGTPGWLADALPLLAINSVTMLGAEIHGRSYGGGILKMEPREAARLPVPNLRTMRAGWTVLKPERSSLERMLQDGEWTTVRARVDEVVLRGVLELADDQIEELQDASRLLREHRTRRREADGE